MNTLESASETKSPISTAPRLIQSAQAQPSADDGTGFAITLVLAVAALVVFAAILADLIN